MKKLVFILLLFTISLFSYNKKAVQATIRSAAEETITKSGFSLLSEEIQNEALKEQGAQTDDGDCIDDTCLMDTGKMLAAQRLFLIKVSDFGNNNYMFKIIHMNLETNETISVRSEIFSGDLNNVQELFKFSKKFLSSITREVKQNDEKEKIPVMLQLLFDVKSADDVKKHILALQTKYDPVNVYEGKKFWGVTPLKIPMTEGIHSFIFEKLGYEPLKKDIKVIRDLKITHIPFKKAIILTVKSRLKNADVFVNRADAGSLKNGELKLTLKSGEYEITLAKNGYESKTLKINLSDYIKKPLDFGEIYKKGGPYPVKIKAIVKSKVFIDGKFKGYTPLEVRLKKGTYKLNLYNDVANNKKFKLKVSKPSEFYYKMNSGFNFIDVNFNSMYLYTNFPWQKRSSHFFFGIDAKLFTWNWKYFDIDILGGGMYQGFDREIFYKLHLFEVNFKPVKNLKINIAIGPFLGDFIDYDNVEDLYRTFGGIKLEYCKVFSGLWYLNIETAAYYGTKNSEHSYYSSNNNSMDNGWLFSGSLGIGIFY